MLTNSLNVGEFIFTASERDLTFKLYCVESEHPSTIDKLKSSIEKEYMWKIDRFINSRILQVQQKNVVKYVSTQDVLTLDDILSDVQKHKNANI